MSDQIHSAEEVIKHERDQVLYKRRPPDDPSIGIAMSGGGIRSATFNLGLLRVLEAKGLLKLADYLSTVSGGGYVGSYFIANRLAGRTVEQDETTPYPDATEAVKALKHLRRFGNYLSPAVGLFSVDTWSMVMVWFRNTSVLQVFLLCIFAMVLLMPRFWAMLVRFLLYEGGDWVKGGGDNVFVFGSIALFHAATAFITGAIISEFDGVGSWSDFGAAWKGWLKPPLPSTSLQGLRFRLFVIVLIAIVGSALFVIGGFQAFASGGKPFAHLAIRFGFTLGSAGFFLSLFSLGFGRGFKGTRGLRATFAIVYITSLTALSYAAPILGWWSALAIVGVIAALTAAGARWVFTLEPYERMIDIARAAFASIVCGVFAGAGIYIADSVFGAWAWRITLIINAAKSGTPTHLASSDLWNYALFAAPGLLAQLGLSIVVLIAITGRAMPDLVREAWSRFGALIALTSAALLGLGWIGIFGPLFLLQIWQSWNGYVVASGGVATALLGAASLLAANSDQTDGKKKEGTGINLKEVLVGAAPTGFVLILFCAVSIGLHLLLAQAALAPGSVVQLPDRAAFEQAQGAVALGQRAAIGTKLETFKDLSPPLAKGRWNGPDWPSAEALITFHWSILEASVAGQWQTMFLLFGVLSLVFSVLAVRLDVNEFSINRFYRNRIVRCFIGAARTEIIKRDPLTGFDIADDVQMGVIARFLTRDKNLPPRIPTLADATPIPIINTALNMVGGADASLSERRAESCFFTPFYGYSKSTRAMPISDLSTGRSPVTVTLDGQKQQVSDVTLGSLVAISGAAANPNMGFHSSPTVAFLLTFFNIRLGWWVGVPARLEGKLGWLKRRLNIAYVFFELFGTADKEDAFVNLSDGGHFENLGLYELVRRECDLIFVGDGEQDTNYVFESLGMAIRRCRIDFGAQVDIDVSGIRPIKEGGDNPKHWTVGKIRYRGDVREGYIVYLKSSYTSREPYDVQQYRLANPDFPQQPTGDQFFNESQLESYRQVGIHAAAELVKELGELPATRADWLAAAKRLYVSQGAGKG